MIETVHPSLRHWLHAFDGSNIVGLAVVVPGDDLGEGDLGAILDEEFPALGEEPVVAAVHEVFVVCLRTVVLKKKKRIYVN